jgi:serine/threonine protein kinase
VTLAAGSRLGPYEVLSRLGAGGMGEVFRARDTRLDRDVAIKVLPEEFFEDKERRERFEREAKSLAAVSHTNIAAGVEREVNRGAARYFRKSATSGTLKPALRRVRRTPPPSIVETRRKAT